MPVLPLLYFDPYYATLGVMLYPDDEMRARAWIVRRCAAQAAPRLAKGEYVAPILLKEIASLADISTEDWKKRYWLGTAVGELFKAYFALHNTDPALASWNNASLIAEMAAAQDNAKGARSLQWRAKEQFHTVAHLWAAWCIRKKRLQEQLEVGYTASDDVQAFLAEAEMLRMWGQTWRQSREKSVPPLPDEVWTVGPNWPAPARKPDWPLTGGLPFLTLDETLISAAGLRPAGRPRLHS